MNLKDFPKTEEDIPAILFVLNDGQPLEDLEGQLKWDFDCGFKLDFDGPIIRISSRYYIVKRENIMYWEGTLNVYLLNRQIESVDIIAINLTSLFNQVIAYRNTLIKRITIAPSP